MACGPLINERTGPKICYNVIEREVLSYICTRKLNQDHVENLHSQIRGFNGFNDHPNVPDYVNALRGLACKFSTSELIESCHPAGANCESLDWEEEEECGKENEPPASAAAIQEQTVDPIDFDTECEWEDLEPIHVSCIPDVLSPIEEETVVYIAGACMRKLICVKGQCEACIGVCVNDTDPCALFSTFKNFKEGALLNVSMPLRNLAKGFESFFKGAIEQALLSDHPRKFIISSFCASSLNDFPPLSCPQHGSSIIQKFLEVFCNTRIFQSVKLCNERLKAGKKGNDLNKMKKLGM